MITSKDKQKFIAIEGLKNEVRRIFAYAIENQITSNEINIKLNEKVYNTDVLLSLPVYSKEYINGYINGLRDLMFSLYVQDMWIIKGKKKVNRTELTELQKKGNFNYLKYEYLGLYWKSKKSQDCKLYYSSKNDTEAK